MGDDCSRVSALISVNLHLFRPRLCLLASLCVHLPVSSLLGRRDVVGSAALVIGLRRFFHSGLWPVDHRVAHILQFLVRQRTKAESLAGLVEGKSLNANLSAPYYCQDQDLVTMGVTKRKAEQKTAATLFFSVIIMSVLIWS